MNERRKDFVIIVLLAAATLVLSFIRFPRTTRDSDRYLLLVEIFRGNVLPSEAISPFCYRPLLPLIIALFPTDPLITWCLSSALFNVLLVPTIYYICKELGLGTYGAITGTGFSTISYMSVAVGSWVITDVAAMLLLALVLLSILRKDNPSVITGLLVIGTLFKEFVILGAVVWFLYEFVRPTLRGKINSIIAGITTVGVYLGVRFIWTSVGVFNYMWGWNNFWNFINQPEGIAITFFVTLVFFVPCIIASCIVGYKTKVPQFRATIIWLIVCTPLLIYLGMGLFMAYFDVRFVWPLYLGMAPLAGIFGDWFLPKVYNVATTILNAVKTISR